MYPTHTPIFSDTAVNDGFSDMKLGGWAFPEKASNHLFSSSAHRATVFLRRSGEIWWLDISLVVRAGRP